MIPRPRVPHVRRSTVVLVLAVAALAFPLGALANHQFTDVPTDASYHDDVEALVAAGVTSGCGGGKYCPGNAVTRGQMAQFLNRLGALDGQTPSVNAATAQSASSVDGWSVGCPVNTVLSGGLCFDTTTRSTGDVFAASVFCADLGGGLFGRGQIWKLPELLELRAADENGDIAITAEEWSSTFYFDDANGAQAAGVVGNGGTQDNNTLDILPFRCAAIPLQIDSFIFIPLGEEQDGTDAGPSTDRGDVISDDGTMD